MGKAAKAKRAPTINMLAIRPQTPRGPATVTLRAVPMTTEATRSAQRNVQLPAAEVAAKPGGAVMTEEELTVSRKDEIEALPVFKEVTGLEAVMPASPCMWFRCAQERPRSATLMRPRPPEDAEVGRIR